MPHIVFSNAWAAEVAAAINASAAYREAGRAWEGALLLAMLGDTPAEQDLRVWLDLQHGECRAARAATVADEELSRYVLSATRGTWQALLDGRLAPLMAILTGKLKLTKGNLAELLPFVGAAKEMMAAASGVEASWPEGA